MKHTKWISAPWKILESEELPKHVDIWSEDEEWCIVQNMCVADTVSMARDDAKHIVKCVNLHDDLIHALEQVAQNYDANVLQYVKELLKQAKEG